MIKKSLIAIVGAVLLVAVLAAGCTSNTSTSSSNPNTAQQSSGSDMTAKIISYVQSQGYTVTRNVTRDPAGVGKYDSYSGTATDDNGKQVSFVVQTFNSPTETSDGYHSAVKNYQGEGYTVLKTENTTTTLKGSQGNTAVISQDTADNMVVVFLPYDMPTASSVAA